MGKIMQRLKRFAVIALSAASLVIAFGLRLLRKIPVHRRNPTFSHHGRRHRLLEYQRLQPRNDGISHPNIDRIASEGAIFTDYYGQQSCTAGRAAFITGQSRCARVS